MEESTVHLAGIGNVRMGCVQGEGARKGSEQLRHSVAPNMEGRWLTPPGHHDARGKMAARATRRENAGLRGERRTT